MEVKLKDWSQQDRQTGLVVAFGLWNTRVSLQIYKAQDMRNKLFRRNFDECEVILVEKLINKVMNGSPDTKQTIQFTKMDFNTKQRSLEMVFEFSKDSKQVYHLTISDVPKQQTYSFTLKARANMTVGNEPMSEGTVSALKVEALKDWFMSAKIAAPFTFQPMAPGKGGAGGRGGYGGGNGGGSYQPSQAPAPSDGGGETLPF